MKHIKKIVKFSFLLIIIGILIVLGSYGYAKLTPKLQIKSANSISLYDNKGELYFRGNGSSEWIALKNISKDLINSTIYAEDKNFYKHFGFDLLRIAKASFINITSGEVKQGASTISQQYSKNLFLDFEQTWKRKWDELWLTIKLESNYDKNAILEGYLNTINYGHGMYGIENAAKYYFDKSAADLNLAEASMLTGIPKSPANFSPLVNLEKAKYRQKIILNLMVNNKVITKEEAKNAYDTELKFIGKKDLINLTTVMYYQDAVIKELKTLKNIPNSFLETGGLKIYTNLDIASQTLMENTINTNFGEQNTLQISSIMMDPNTGKVFALTGGRDFSKSQFNRAIQSKRQVGSTMKPFLYYTALENGFTGSTAFTSSETTFTFSNNKTYSPKNSGEKYGNKPISMATAIAYSDNIYAVKTHMFLGEEMLVDFAKRVGINAKLEVVPSLPLGTSEINIMELTAGYSAFANEGYKVTPHLINKVEDVYGNILYQNNGLKEGVLNKSITYILNNLLTCTYDSAFIDYNYPTAITIAPKMTKTYAIKSGTTDTDTWYIGYNKDVITSVWIGYDDNKVIEANEYKYSKNIWLELMEGYLKDKKNNWYEKPNNVVGVLVEPISGKPLTESGQKGKIMYFVKGTEPSLDDPVFDEITSKEN
ncbi:MAG: PBP1A family penicillin-binding protein [Bacilli bacterium]